MILGQVSWLDCIVFLIFLAPQLLIHVGLLPTIFCALRALPFLLIQLPISFIYDHFVLSQQYRPPFVQKASWFEDVVIRCVRYAFAYIPASIGSVFFSKWVSLPFLRFRMIRHGYFRSPVSWHELNQPDFSGLWIIEDMSRIPDLVIFYAHGGGFSMGSSYFYLEFLFAYHALLRETKCFKNVAILALEYDLVPKKSYPVQLKQAVAGYSYVLSLTQDPSRIVVSGDSAGATIILSLLLHLGSGKSHKPPEISRPMNDHFSLGKRPGLAILISPWVTLTSSLDKNTTSDYLDASNLHLYAKQYVGVKASLNDPLVSPGNCKDKSWWRDSAPEKGIFISFGAEEVFAPEIEGLISFLEDSSIPVKWEKECGGIHAWPVACLFLSGSKKKRTKGLETIVRQIVDAVAPAAASQRYSTGRM